MGRGRPHGFLVADQLDGVLYCGISSGHMRPEIQPPHGTDGTQGRRSARLKNTILYLMRKDQMSHPAIIISPHGADSRDLVSLALITGDIQEFYIKR
jgi:hypothetical protein